MYVLGVFLLEGTNQPQMIKCSRYELDTIEQNRGLEKGCHCVWFVCVCVCFLLALKSHVNTPSQFTFHLTWSCPEWKDFHALLFVCSFIFLIIFSLLQFCPFYASWSSRQGKHWRSVGRHLFRPWRTLGTSTWNSSGTFTAGVRVHVSVT